VPTTKPARRRRASRGEWRNLTGCTRPRGCGPEGHADRRPFLVDPVKLGEAQGVAAAAGKRGSVFCRRCGHRDVYHQVNAPDGERRCVWNPEKCRCRNFEAVQGPLRVV
jgi:hypothetical protein